MQGRADVVRGFCREAAYLNISLQPTAAGEIMSRRG